MKKYTYLSEIALMVAILILVGLFWSKGNVFFLRSPVHPYLLVVILISARYGMREGLISTGVSVVLYAGSAFVHAHRLFGALGHEDWRIFFLMVLVSVLLGSLKEEQKKITESAKGKLEQAQEQTKRLSAHNEVLEAANKELRGRVLGETATFGSLFEMAQTLTTLEVKFLYPAILDIVVQHLGATACSLYLKENNILRLISQKGWDQVPESAKKISVNGGMMSKVAKEGKLLSLRDLAHQEESLESQDKIMCAPMKDPKDGTVLGLISVERLPYTKFTPSALKVLSMIAEWGAKAMTQAEIFSEAEAKALESERAVSRMLEVLKSRTLSQSEVDSFVELGEAACEKLVEILDSPEASVNEKYNSVLALKALADRGQISIPRESLQRFIENELQLAYRRMLIMFHGKFQVTRGVELLFQHMQEKNEEALIAVIGALSMAGEDILDIPRVTIYQVKSPGTAEWHELMSALRAASGHEIVSRQAAHLGKKLPAHVLRVASGQEMASRIVALMEGDPGRIKEIARKSWGINPVTRDEALREMLQDRDIWVQVCALYIIGEMRITALKWEVFKKIEDADEVVRETAIRSLGFMKDEIKDPVIQDTLQKIVSADKGAVKEAAQGVLEDTIVSVSPTEAVQESIDRR